MNWKIIIFGGLMLCGGLIFGQHQNITISTANEPNEPTIMINPKNTNQIIAGANTINVYYSSDGGYTWNEDTLVSPYGVWGDPVVVVDTTGAFYFFHLSNPPITAGNWIDRIVCQKMNSLGSAWSPGTFTGLDGTKAQDKQWAVVNPNNNHIYLTWTQFDNYGSGDLQDSSIIRFSKSIDGGLTWANPLRINKIAGDCIDEDNTVEGAVPAVGPNGEIYVSWAGPAGLVFDRSEDDGNTWLDNDIFVSDIPGGWDFNIPGISRANGMPITLCDLSNGPHRGTIYINWSDQRNGTTDTDIWLIKSTDGGNTWSVAKRVNNDPPGKQNFFTWMTVDQATGYLWCVFYDRRNYTNNQTDVYVALSKDGGDNFINFKVSESAFLPNQAVFFGDYTNISAYNNVVRPIWTRLQQGQLSIITAIVDPTVVGTNEINLNPKAETELYPNPFTDRTWFSYKITRNTVVDLRLVDSYGREVAVVENHQRKVAGWYIEHIDSEKLNLNSGVYYIILKTESGIQKQQVILVK